VYVIFKLKTMTIKVKEITAKTIDVKWIEVEVYTDQGLFVLRTDMVRLASMDKESWAKRAMEGWFDDFEKIKLEIC